MSWINTYQDKVLDFRNPKPESIDIIDIARGLSHACRFSGQISKFYSVAEHSCHIYDMLEELEYSEQYQIYGLLHDASEAYLCDINMPLKQLLPDYRKIEKQLMDVIIGKFMKQVEPRVKSHVKEFDMSMLKCEAIDLGFNVREWPVLAGVVEAPVVIKYWDPNTAMGEFMDRANELGLK